MIPPRKASGFTLIELALVMAILGLIAGGVVVGQSMVRSAAVNKVAREAQQYRHATEQFVAQYNEIPGDMATASRLWGSAADCAQYNSGDDISLTCNGNGNRQISDNRTVTTGNTYLLRPVEREKLVYFNHLMNAGLIEGRYTGIPVYNSSYMNNTNIGSSNVPPTALSKRDTCFVPGYWSQPGGFSSSYWGDNFALYGTWLHAGGRDVSAPNIMCGAVAFMTPQEAYELDKKYDDAKPGRGRVFGTRNTGCATSTDEETADYALTNSAVGCSLRFKIL